MVCRYSEVPTGIAPVYIVEDVVGVDWSVV